MKRNKKIPEMLKHSAIYYLYSRIKSKGFTLENPLNIVIHSKIIELKNGKLSVNVFYEYMDVCIVTSHNRIVYDKKGGTHASPIPHYRAGHFRSQPYGAKDKPEYKTIWIKPQLIGMQSNGSNQKSSDRLNSKPRIIK